MSSDTGLLGRAAAIRRLRREASSAGASGPASLGRADEPSEADAEAGITPEERREISAAIEEVARSNRLSGGATATALVARKRGVLLPLLVNLSALLVTALVLFFLARAFGAREEAAASQSGALASAEGRLLQELKRESDARLKEKDRAIADIQSKMQAIDRERIDLQSTMDQRIKAREAELQAQLQEELKQERARLEAQGLGEEAIQARLKAFEDQKNREFQAALAAFRAQAEADRAAADRNYQKLKDDYSRNMSALGDERKKILDDAKAQEEQLRSTMEAKTRELEAQGAAAQSALAKAKADLARLQDQRDAAQAAEDRILGFYASVRQALQDRRFGDAARAADSLAAYLGDPSVASLPSLQSRRAMDLFVAQTLGDEARTQLSNASADTGRLLEQARLLGQAREAVQAAQAARKNGDLPTAEARYQDALALVPEILEAHQYFLDKSQAEARAGRDRLDQQLKAADTAWAAGDGATALARYTEALSYLPVAEADKTRLLQRVGQLAVTEAQRRLQQGGAAAAAADSAAARPFLDAGVRALAASRWDEAIGSFLEVLSRWPRAEGAGAALEGLRTAGRGLDQALTSLSAKGQGEAEAEKAKSAALTEELAKTAADRDALSRKNAEAGSAITALQAKMDALTEENAKLASQLSTLAPAAAQAASSLDLVALQKQVDDLRNLERRWIGVTEAYGDFLVASAAAKGNTTAELASLKAFLADARVSPTFDRIGSTLDSLLARWGSEAGADGLHNASLIAVQAASIKDGAARDRYLSGQLAVFSADPLVSGFVSALREAWK